MRVTGTKQKKLRQVIISAYPSKADLEIMVSDELEENLDAIAGGDNLTQVIFNLIKWADSQGKLEDLINAAKRGKPGNQELREFQLSAPDELIKDTNKDNNIPKQQNSLQEVNPQPQMQLAKNIVNIAEGKDIHIGDRITNEVIDEETKEILRGLQQKLKKIDGEKLSQTTSKNVDTTNSPTQLLFIAPPPELRTFDFKVVTVDPQGRKIKRTSKQAEYFTEDLGDGVALEMVSIPGGPFQMGSPQDEKASQESERPQHMVNVKPFFMSRYPITQAQWKIVANSSQIEERPLEFDDPSCFKGDNLPVERVSWYDAREFCQRLSRKTGRIYRLPSEAQWEYACRAKETTPFHFGKTITTDLANYRGQDREINGHLYKGTYGGELPGVDRQRTTEVGSFPPNAFGLCDMHGLVWEWCADCEHENYQDAPSDGSVWLSDDNEEYRILRGGSWDSFSNLCRSASRFSESADVRDKEFGFRVVCSLM